METIVHVLRDRAAADPTRKAFAFLAAKGEEKETLSYAQLDAHATNLATRIRRIASPGDRVIVACPPGLDFIIAFFGCLYARAIAVPVIMPRQQRLHEATLEILRDCSPSLGLSVGDHCGAIAELLSERDIFIPWFSVAERSDPTRVEMPALSLPQAASIAFIQYTSGSTSQPKGVAVSHANLIANLAMTTDAYAIDRSSTRVSWLPLHHDMGLIFGVLQASFSGALCVLMPATAFIKQPLSWLQAISRYKAELAIAPNFAYDICADSYRADALSGVDLSCWKLAINGAEPVRSDTLDRFARTFAGHGFDRTAFHPGYGMAEATLVIAGGRLRDQPRLKPVDRDALMRHEVAHPSVSASTQILVGCGKALQPGRVAIVDPVTRQGCPAASVGEIWLQGPHVATGYWNRSEATHEIFAAERVDEPGSRWLRTGDLGFFDENDEIFIAGRLKDVIIVQGRNHYPQDLEWTVERHPAVRKGFVAAFGITVEAREQVVIACEIKREHLRRLDTSEVSQDIREALILEHGLALRELVLIGPGLLPRTTSGKVRRQRTRQLWEAGTFMEPGFPDADRSQPTSEGRLLSAPIS